MKKLFLDACGISKKYEISKETIFKYNMKDEFPEVFEKKLDVGKWYVYHDSNSLAYIEELYNSDFLGFGFDYRNDFKYSTRGWTSGFKGWHEATTQEVEEALIREAKKRGLIDLVVVKSTTGVIGILNKGTYVFNCISNKLYYAGYEIFDNGKWAEIIKTYTKEEAEKLLNCKIIDTLA